MMPSWGAPPSKFALRPKRAPEPAFLLKLDPWYRTFLRNLADLVWPRRRPALNLSSTPGIFWPDVFVESRPPWGRLPQSLLCHVAAFALIWGAVRFWPTPAVAMERAVLSHDDVVYYSADDYLPPLDTGNVEPAKTQKGDPVYAKQPIISVPPETDNHEQTIVTPSPFKLKQNVALPNIVSWSHPEPAVPIEATRSLAEAKLPVLPISVVEPAPQVSGYTRSAAPLLQAVVEPSPDVKADSPRRGLQEPAVAIVAPPPNVEPGSVRRAGEINIGHQNVVAPAPALPVVEQRVGGGRGGAAASLGSGPAVVPPPPSISGSAEKGARGRIIALGIHPAALQGPINPPAGNRQGAFAASPTGKPGAAGTPDIAATPTKGNGSGGSSGSKVAGVPSGLMVGEVGAKPGDHDSSLIADTRAPRVGTKNHQANEVSESNATELDRQVFGDRKFYSMTLNMPNLNSAGGSWVIRFAEIGPTDDSDKDKPELTAPVATQKVDPAYPIELMRHNVQGTVTLRAIIRRDGSVGEVRVVRGVDDRLDEYACNALAHWRFQPGTKNGAPVDLEALVIIPFRAIRGAAGF